jgi:DNA-directed RNA polymerase III subunit RPC8
MYVLSEMRDIVHVKPWQFDQDLRVVIEDELNKKYANKVLYELGLCVALFDIKNIEDSYVFPGDGSSHTRVTFRYVVFRPFVDEILVGKVKSCSKEGVYISMQFFDDIFIPASNLQKPNRFEEKEQLFIWQYDTGETVHDLYLDIGEEIRFRVVNEVFIDTTPNGPPKKNDVLSTTSVAHNKEEIKSPYSIIGSISEPGLGLLSWWQ